MLYYRCIAACIIITLDFIIGGNGATLHFAEGDMVVSEDKSPAQIVVQVDGENAGNFTAIVTPLTVTQYRAQREKYGTICDPLINLENLAEAEGN